MSKSVHPFFAIWVTFLSINRSLVEQLASWLTWACRPFFHALQKKNRRRGERRRKRDEEEGWLLLLHQRVSREGKSVKSPRRVFSVSRSFSTYSQISLPKPFISTVSLSTEWQNVNPCLVLMSLPEVSKKLPEQWMKEKSRHGQFSLLSPFQGWRSKISIFKGCYFPL